MRKPLGALTALLALIGLALAGSAIADERGEQQDGEHRGLPTATRVDAADAPRISVIVATRDRPDMLRQCVSSILANEHHDFELVVVDQSSVPAELPPDPRVRHVHSTTIGKSAALNVGIRTARGAIIAFTDDDCTAGTDWLTKAESLLVEHPELDMAFGVLVPIQHDASQFLVPITMFKNDSLRVVRGRRFAYVKGGAGANLLVRRHLLDAIGDWDEQIGPGSQFKACEEWDMYYRALASGAAVAFVPDLEIVHWGIRSQSDGQDLAWGYSYGEGTVIGKHLRLRDPGMVLPALRILVDDLVDVPRHLWHGERPGLRSLAWKCSGIVAGARHPVDRDRRVFLA